MIFVNQPLTPPPALDLTNPVSKASKELARAMVSFQSDGSIPLSKELKAYTDDFVKEQLREIFHGKCAYCESLITGNHDNDIEHYRPKLGVTDAKKQGVDHKGYWWLAMNWSNLVLSCQHCNQLRKQVVIPEGETDVEKIKKLFETASFNSVGKKNAFPTEDDIWVTSPDEDCESEKPLIINPTKTNPDIHLEYVFVDNFTTMRAKNQSKIGKTTINVLGLNRRHLAENRYIRHLELKSKKRDIFEAVTMSLKASSNNEKEIHESYAKKYLVEITEYCEPSRPFSGMSKAFLSEILSELKSLRKQHS